MDAAQLAGIVRAIVSKAKALKDKHTTFTDAPVNYAAVFSQDARDFTELCTAAQSLGSVVKTTKTGPIFKINSMSTSAGELILLKIRLPDKTRPELGDADFTIADFEAFKASVLRKKKFKHIQRDEFQMVELIDPEFNVRAYFSNPTQLELLNI